MWPLFYASFTGLQPEKVAQQVINARTSASLEVSADAYTVLATGLYTLAAASYANTDAATACWTGPASDAACQGLNQFSGWLRGQADNAMRTATVIRQVQFAAAAAEIAMVQVMAVYIPLAAKTTADVALSIAHPAAGLPLVAQDEISYNALQAEATAVMTAYATGAGLSLNTLPTSTAPPLIATPAALLDGGGSTTGYGDPLGLPGTGGGRRHSGGTSPGTGGGPVSNPSGSSPISGQTGGSQPGGGQPGGSQPGGGQPGGSQPGGGQPGGSQPGGSQPGGEPGSGLPDPQQPSADSQAPASPSDSLPSLGDGTGGPDDQGVLYGVSPNSPTLNGLLGVGPGSTVTPGMTGGGSVVSSGGLKLPTAWRPATAQTFGAATESPAPQPVSPRQPPRGANAPDAQRRRDRKDERKRSATSVAGDGVEAAAADLPYVIESDADDIEPVSESEKVLAFGMLDRDSHQTTEFQDH
ncbi:PPE domain-containing protein [Nocardia sp. NPDC046763]|uniref:PPE domain-containing protein n=1 Tax=Nocardia sp. NPDC046763 TaxID=3155256 RepID=UPI0033FF10E5